MASPAPPLFFTMKSLDVWDQATLTEVMLRDLQRGYDMGVVATDTTNVPPWRREYLDHFRVLVQDGDGTWLEWAPTNVEIETSPNGGTSMRIVAVPTPHRVDQAVQEGGVVRGALRVPERPPAPRPEWLDELKEKIEVLAERIDDLAHSDWAER